MKYYGFYVHKDVVNSFAYDVRVRDFNAGTSFYDTPLLKNHQNGILDSFEEAVEHFSQDQYPRIKIPTEFLADNDYFAVVYFEVDEKNNDRVNRVIIEQPIKKDSFGYIDATKIFSVYSKPWDALVSTVENQTFDNVKLRPYIAPPKSPEEIEIENELMKLIEARRKMADILISIASIAYYFQSTPYGIQIYPKDTPYPVFKKFLDDLGAFATSPKSIQKSMDPNGYYDRVNAVIDKRQIDFLKLELENDMEFGYRLRANFVTLVADYFEAVHNRTDLTELLQRAQQLSLSLNAEVDKCHYYADKGSKIEFDPIFRAMEITELKKFASESFIALHTLSISEKSATASVKQVMDLDRHFSELNYIQIEKKKDRLVSLCAMMRKALVYFYAKNEYQQDNVFDYFFHRALLGGDLSLLMRARAISLSYSIYEAKKNSIQLSKNIESTRKFLYEVYLLILSYFFFIFIIINLN